MSHTWKESGKNQCLLLIILKVKSRQLQTWCLTNLSVWKGRFYSREQEAHGGCWRGPGMPASWVEMLYYFPLHSLPPTLSFQHRVLSRIKQERQKVKKQLRENAWRGCYQTESEVMSVGIWKDILMNTEWKNTWLNGKKCQGCVGWELPTCQQRTEMKWPR